MRFYSPNFSPTANYIAGMVAIEKEDLQSALAILSKEPRDSAFYGMALANKALVQLRMERFQHSEVSARLALTEFLGKGCPHPPTWVQTLRNLGEAISLQGGNNESIDVFRNCCDVAENLAISFPDFATDCILEKAHTFNSWGGAFLKSGVPDRAIDCLTAGRDIYRRHPNNTVGCGETLTNLAQAYTETGRKMEASLAINEARQLAQGDDEELHRINIVGARLGIFSKNESRRLLLEAANAAACKGFSETAYIRHCIAALLAEKYKDVDWGTEVVNLAATIEGKLHPDSLQPAKLSFYKASFLEQAGQSVRTVINELLHGARMWCDRLPGRFGIHDYQHTVAGMHDHFRKLSGLLLREGRIEEAFVAFETGRSRGFALEVNKTHDHPLLTANPFTETEVDFELLKRIQEGLEEGEAIISLAVLPPHLVAFIVGQNAVEICELELVRNATEAHVFGEAVRAIPSNLEAGRGVDCVPDQFVNLSREIANRIGTRRIVLLAPHATLHKVPWRTLLRCAGLGWNQLPFITQFSPLLDPDRPNPDTVLPQNAVALGHGFAGTGTNVLNLEDEAREFSETFGGQGRLIRAARSADVTTALDGGNTVLISCHGKIVLNQHGDRFVFELADGRHEPGDLIQGPVAAPLVILSACSSGVYEMATGDYPVGAAPSFLLAGAKFCACTRFLINAHFAKDFFPKFGELLFEGQPVGQAFANALAEMEAQNYNIWRHIACVELLGRGIFD